MGGGCCIGNCCVMDNVVGDWFRDIFGSGSGGGCGYHPGPSETDAHAKKIADELADMKGNIRKSSEKKEREIIDYINTNMNSFISELSELNKREFGGRQLNVNINGIRQKNEQLKGDVIGYIGNFMDGRLVLTDPELSVILEERDDKKRGNNFDAFCKRIQKQALSGLKQKIENTVKKQEEMIRKEIQNRLDEVNASTKEAGNAYMELVSIKEKDDAEIGKTQIKYIYKYTLEDILLNELES